jgi:hypothetical protein
MSKPSKVQIAVAEFANIRPQYVEFGRRLSDLLRTLMASASIQIHALEYRTKTVVSAGAQNQPMMGA